MITGNKLAAFIERVEFDNRPITADIFLTDYCNNKCYYCRYKKRTGKYINLETFVRIVERLKSIGVRSVILTGGGEPTINPDFDKICAYLDEIKMPYGINTNMNVLPLVKPTYLKVSLDTGRRDEYLKVRGADTFLKVLQNISKYAEWKKEFSPGTKLGVQCVTDGNVDQVRDFYEVVKKLDVDYIQFRPIEKTGPQSEYKDVLTYLRALNDKRVIISFKFSAIGWKPKKCLAHWAAITINVDGDVLYCCHKPDEIIGNVFDDNITDKILNAETDMGTCEVPCRLSGANQFLTDYDNKKDKDRFFI